MNSWYAHDFNIQYYFVAGITALWQTQSSNSVHIVYSFMGDTFVHLFHGDHCFVAMLSLNGKHNSAANLLHGEHSDYWTGTIPFFFVSLIIAFLVILCLKMLLSSSQAVFS